LQRDSPFLPDGPETMGENGILDRIERRGHESHLVVVLLGGPSG
jgi:hypothetical protein